MWNSLRKLSLNGEIIGGDLKKIAPAPDTESEEWHKIYFWCSNKIIYLSLLVLRAYFSSTTSSIFCSAPLVKETYAVQKKLTQCLKGMRVWRGRMNWMQSLGPQSLAMAVKSCDEARRGRC